MNKTVISRRGVRAVLLCMLAILLPALSSCKKESADTSDLLATVPSSASAVIGINMNSLLQKAGCKVSGSEITPGKEVEAWLSRQTDVKGSELETVRLFLNGESGIDPTGAIFFKDAYNSYVTAVLADTEKFTSLVEANSGSKFSEEGDVKVCGNVAVRGAQMWVCVSSQNTIDTKAVVNYSTLSESQSFMTNGFSSKIATMTSDIVGWGEIKSLMGPGVNLSQLSSVNLVTGMLFDDAKSVSFSVDFLKGELKASATALNGKGEPAKYLFPSEKIDLSTLKSVGQNAEAFGAMSITKKLIEKINKAGSAFGGGMMSALTETLKSVDGTVAVAFGNVSDPTRDVCGVVTTDGDTNLSLMQMISQYGSTQKDGKLVRFSNGTLSGSLDINKDADLLKGATLGFVSDMKPFAGKNTEGLRAVAFAFVPRDGGIAADVTVLGTDNSKNILLTILEAN